MASVNELRKRWKNSPGKELVGVIHEMIMSGAPREEFEKLLAELPFSVHHANEGVAAISLGYA